MIRFKYKKPEHDKLLLIEVEDNDYLLGKVTYDDTTPEDEVIRLSASGSLMDIEDEFKWEYLEEIILDCAKWRAFVKIHKSFDRNNGE